MTDNEIIKALECCTKTESLGDCEKLKCPMYTKNGCAYYLGVDEDHEHTICYEHFKNALALIKHQQAEIKLLKTDPNRRVGESAIWQVIEASKRAEQKIAARKAETKAEAIKDFAERVKTLNSQNLIIWNEQIDNLVKEMAGEQE